MRIKKIMFYTPILGLLIFIIDLISVLISTSKSESVSEKNLFYVLDIYSIGFINILHGAALGLLVGLL